MRLLCITDLHGSATALARILAHAGPTDLVLLGGDITNFQSPDRAERLVQQAQVTGVPVLAVAGNCDSPQIDQRLAEMGVSLFGRSAIRNGVGFYGVSAMPPWTGTMYELTESQIETALTAGRTEVLRHHLATEVILSHPPPRGLVDRTRSGQHVGSTALRSFIERHRPILVVSGHIHEARGVDRWESTTVVNCGLAGAGCYALVELSAAVAVQLRQAV
jgi:Icc-related predicted phosphoesterase